MRASIKEMVSTGPILIQTAEDARWQFLRGVINEEELKEILAKFGQTIEPTTLGLPLPTQLERFDDAFERKLPGEPEAERPLLKERLKATADKEKEREAAVKAAAK